MPKIIIIDDDSVCNMLTERVLNKYVNADILSFVDAKKALDYITSQPTLPEHILLDIIMPQMDGWQFLDRLKDEVGSANITSKVTILTSSIRESDRQKALSFSCIKNYANKPLEKEDLLRVFNKDLLIQTT